MGCVIDDGIKEGNDTPLWNAALKGHVAIMRKLINRGADVNACVPDDIGSVVNAAIYSGNREAIELLIEKKASLSMIGSQDQGNYALSVAAQFSDLTMFEYLINSCAEKLAPEEYDAALVAAAEAGRVEVFTKLLTFTHSKECYQQALNVATIEENWDIITLLLEHYQGETLDYGDVFRKASGTSENQDGILQVSFLFYGYIFLYICLHGLFYTN
jgi:ankyrin repeat protein